MILRFRVENFRSIKEMQELSFIANASDDLKESLTTFDHYRILRSAAIYGANASGKSNILKAISFMQKAVQESFRLWNSIPCEPFLLHPEWSKHPSIFDLDFIFNNVRYSFGFTINHGNFSEEHLYAYPNNRKQIIYERNNNKFTKFNLNPDAEPIQRLVKDSALFLSAAGQIENDQILSIYNYLTLKLQFFSSGTHSLGRESVTSRLFQADPRIGNRIRSLIKIADLGIHDIEIKEESLINNEFLKTLITFFESTIKKDSLEQAIKIPQTRDIISTLHKNNELDIQFKPENESTGTIAWFLFLGPMLIAMAEDGLLYVDELESSLHPFLVRKIVEFFQNPELNPKGGQLLFTTHNTTLLDLSLLRRDAIWFTEKDADGATHLYPLTDFSPRKNENIEKGYIQGRYGAIPYIGELTNVL